MARLKEELDTFEKNRAGLLEENEGRYVVIRRSSILGVYDSSEDAFVAAMATYGAGTPFLIQRIVPERSERVEAPALRLGLLAVRGL